MEILVDNCLMSLSNIKSHRDSNNINFPKSSIAETKNILRIKMSIKQKIAVSILLISTPSIFAQEPVGHSFSKAKSDDGYFISWKEHIIDDPTIAGFNLNGSDGLVMGDIDGDGYEDIVSVHEFDSGYDSSAYDPNHEPVIEGHVRIAFGSAFPDSWTNITLAEGTDTPAPEDAAVADVNGDGFLDVIVAAEQSHLLYLQNPGEKIRSESWPQLILPMTKGRGSFIRVFFGDFNGDGVPEVAAANKGAQMPGPADYAKKTAVSVYQVEGDPLKGSNWHEIELGRYSVPQNSEPVDLDGDGDLDVVVGSRGEGRLIFFENQSSNDILFKERPIEINGTRMSGFNLEYVDLNKDGRLDIIGRTPNGLGWIEQPADIDNPWNSFHIGTFNPDSETGLEVADIDGDGDIDIISGSYSKGSRTSDDEKMTVNDPLGRIGWFENPGDATRSWTRHDISRRKRGMFDKFIARDIDKDGDIDFVGTRGNSAPYDGVFWLEQVRTEAAGPSFVPARYDESPEMPLP
jgi:hypothetical protein